MNYLLSASLVFYLATLAFHIYYLLFMASTLHLSVILHRMSGAYFWVFPKLLIKYGHERLLHKFETYGVKGEVFNLLRNYLQEHYQTVVLNGQTSSWELIKSGVLQWSVLGPFMFLMYINDLPDNIQSTCKIFADDISLFSHVSDKSTSQCELNKDLQVISNWAFQWKTQVNPDPNKQAQEVYFS